MDGNMNYRQALTKAMAMCSQSERCRFDVAAKLRLWELSEEEISKAIDYLIKERFLNEERFVNFYVNDKLRFNKWGKIKLTYMLRQKQIPGELIRSALNRIDDDFYKKILSDLLQSKIKSVKGATEYERKGKLAVFGQSHGFEAELAFYLSGQLIGNDDNKEL
jgi:regulatory protein